MPAFSNAKHGIYYYYYFWNLNYNYLRHLEIKIHYTMHFRTHVLMFNHLHKKSPEISQSLSSSQSSSSDRTAVSHSLSTSSHIVLVEPWALFHYYTLYWVLSFHCVFQHREELQATLGENLTDLFAIWRLIDWHQERQSFVES